jgi:hypothetical protein
VGEQRGGIRDRRTADEDRSHVGPLPGSGIGMANERGEQTGRCEGVADPVFAHHAQDLRRLEHPEQEVGGTGQPRRQEQVARSVGDRPSVTDHAVAAHPLQ